MVVATSEGHEPKRWALLIGIGAYPGLAKEYWLDGAINDVVAIESLLTGDQFGFPRENILTLTSPADDPARLATRENILRGFRSHLIENDCIQSGDVVVIYYSGHGSQKRDLNGDEEGRWDQTLVPCDAGLNGRRRSETDISDDEIGLLLKQLGRRTRNINLFFDSCCSGSITRAWTLTVSRPAACRSRWLPPAESAPPARKTLHRRSAAQTKGPSGWLPLSDDYVVISACKASEEAHQRRYLEGLSIKTYGVFTHSLLGALRDAGPDTEYYDIWSQVGTAVSRVAGDQHPQIEGASERKVFGGALQTRRRTGEVIGSTPEGVILATGLAQGATPDSRFAVYRPGGERFDDRSARVAVVELDTVDAFESTGKVKEGDAAQIVPGAPAIEIEHDYGNVRMPVLVAGDAPLLAEVRREIELSALLTLATAESEPSTATVTLGYLLRPDGEPVTDKEEKLLVLNSGDGYPLVEPVSADRSGVALVRRKLEYIARYYNLLSICNTDEYSELKGKVKLRLLTVIGRDEKGQAQLAPVERTTGGDIVLKVGDEIAIVVENHSGRSLHVALFHADSSWGFSPLFPPDKAEDDTVAPDRSRLLVSPVVDLLDYQKPLRDSWPLPRETVKLIAATRRMDWRTLCLAPIRGKPHPTRAVEGRSSLYKLVNLAWNGGAERLTRSTERDSDPVVKDWTTDELVFHITT